MKFTDAELDVIAAALNVAAIVYHNDAEVSAAAGQQRIAEQFDSQAKDADELREKIDNRE
jgi:hypothetical protein